MDDIFHIFAILQKDMIQNMNQENLLKFIFTFLFKNNQSVASEVNKYGYSIKPNDIRTFREVKNQYLTNSMNFKTKSPIINDVGHYFSKGSVKIKLIKNVFSPNLKISDWTTCSPYSISSFREYFDNLLTPISSLLIGPLPKNEILMLCDRIPVLFKNYFTCFEIRLNKNERVDFFTSFIDWTETSDKIPIIGTKDFKIIDIISKSFNLNPLNRVLKITWIEFDVLNQHELNMSIFFLVRNTKKNIFDKIINELKKISVIGIDKIIIKTINYFVSNLPHGFIFSQLGIMLSRKFHLKFIVTNITKNKTLLFLQKLGWKDNIETIEKIINLIDQYKLESVLSIDMYEGEILTVGFEVYYSRINEFQFFSDNLAQFLINLEKMKLCCSEKVQTLLESSYIAIGNPFFVYLSILNHVKLSITKSQIIVKAYIFQNTT